MSDPFQVRSDDGTVEQHGSTSPFSSSPPASAQPTNNTDDTSEAQQPQEQPQTERVWLGPLPPTFLRLTRLVDMEEHRRQQALMQQQMPSRQAAHPSEGVVTITLIQAKLAKNYGMLKMDPYVSFSIGPFERQSTVCTKGGKEPRWNESIEIPRQARMNILRLAVYDMGVMHDRLIASGQIDISGVDEANAADEWFHLSGKQGQDKEGVIHLVIRFRRQPLPTVYTIADTMPGVQVLTTHQTVMAGTPPMQQQPPRPPPQTVPKMDPQHKAQLKEMFPTFPEDVIETVYLSNQSRIDPTVSQLLAMQTNE